MSIDLDAELHRHFGFPSFRPGQREVVERVIAGQDTLVVMPTGSGKSLCYQLPALTSWPGKRAGATLVVSPLIALMKDQVDALTLKDQSHATYINSSQTLEQQRDRIEGIRKRTYRLIYVAPERFRSASFITAIRSAPVSLFVVDEAHCISEWGHDFRPDYLNLRSAIDLFQRPPVVGLTATATRRVQDDIIRQLELQNPYRIVTGFNRPNLSFEVIYTPTTESKLQQLHALLAEEEYQEASGLIYVGTRRDAEEIAEFVKTSCRLKAEFYHGGLGGDFRQRAHEAFLSGKVKVFVATKAFGMGIDKPDVRFVVHYSIPDSVESYYQEAGRAGRDGEPSRCVLLYSPDDRALQEFFIANSELTQQNLATLFQTILTVSCKGQNPVASAILEQELDCDGIAIRVGVSELEKIGALRRKEDQLDAMTFEITADQLSPSSLTRATNNIRRRIEERRHRLNGVVSYGESNACRRKFILNYFGDSDRPAATHRCCDNCDSRKKPASLTLLDNTDRIILQCVAELRFPLGQEKLTGVLRGSNAKWIKEWNLEKLRYYGRLKHAKSTTLKRSIAFLLEHGYLKTIGGRMPTLALTPPGENVARQPLSTLPERPEPEPPTDLRDLNPKESRAVRKRKEEGSLSATLQETLALFRSGMRTPQIAKERSLSINTIADQLVDLVSRGEIKVDELIKPDARSLIENAIREVGPQSAKAIKELLPESMTYPQIKCVLAAWRRDHPEEVEAQGTASAQPEDVVTAFLHSPHPRPLEGPWDLGFALGFTGSFRGAQYERSEIGEEVFQLKYRGRREMAERIVTHIVEFLADHVELRQVEFLIPVPPTVRGRTYDPVEEIVTTLSRHIGVPSAHVLSRRASRTPQKEIHSQAAKLENVRGVFEVTNRESLHHKRLLLIDDFYDSGATLSECARVLRTCSPVFIGVLTAGKTVHHG